MSNPNAIACISVYQVRLPFTGYGSRWVGRARPDHYDSTIVTLDTESGLVGVGESCPIGAIYLPAFAGGVRAALAELAPVLLGEDATQINRIHRAMNDALYGHGYAKAAIDIACWDLLGQHCAQPVSTLLGGRFAARIPAYAPIPLRAVGEMVDTLRRKQSEGFTRFQIKIGADPLDDIERVRALVAAGLPGDRFIADANCGYSLADARRAIDGLNTFDVYVEQPCASYEECLSIRRLCRRPFILDELIDGPRDLARALADDALDALVIKLTHAGGLAPARLLRDIALARGLEMRIEDTAGSEIARAAQAQLAAATPLSAQLGSYSFQNDHPPVADGAPEVIDGKLILNNRPGLGVTPKPETLGIPLAVYA